MSQSLSDAGRFIRGLTQLSRQVVTEVTRSGDLRRRPPSILEPLSGLISTGLTRLSGVSILNAASKTAWKSSVLVRQTTIAATNAIRSSPLSSTSITRSVEDKIPIPSHAELDSLTASTTTTLVKDKIPIPTYPEMKSSTATLTTSLVSDKFPIPTYSTTETITVKPHTTLVKDKIPIPKHPKLESTIVTEPSMLIKNLDSTTYRPIVKPTNISTTKIDSIKVEPTFFTPSIADESSTPLTLEENEKLISSPPTPSNDEAQARAVPTTRIGRLASFGSLAAGLGVGALGSMMRRSVGLEQTSSTQSGISPYLSKANAERIVDTLCKVRGAALKLGQMISIQDNFLIKDDIQKIFERVRQKADFMPEWQMSEVMTNDFGANWRDQFQEFQDRPFAAASIGQVHYGVLKNSKQRVAVKIQYPGVGKSIESDINNLITLLNFWNILPRGLYIESVIRVAKRELNWEVDYVREAEWGRRFKKWLVNYPIYQIPDIIDSLSSKNVLTTTFFDGTTLDNAINEDQATRDRIGTAILELCLLELFKFKAMQTDPNWSNFLFNPANKTIGLIDFGASREFSTAFIDNYLKIIRASTDNDRKRIEELSIQGGFLTGYETREMIDAHIDAVMILGEGFRTEEAFDFGSQNTTHSIHKLIPVMLKHRLTPPPEDSYSLHRKMSGAFLLCSKLRARVYCKPLFERIWQEYNTT